MKLNTRVVENEYVTGICNVFITLLPVSLVSAFLMLLSQGFVHLNSPTLHHLTSQASSLVLELFPVLLIVYYSQFLATMHKLQRLLVTTPTVLLYFLISTQWDLLSAINSLPSNYFVALSLPICVCGLIKLFYRWFPSLEKNNRDILEESIHMALVCLFVIGSVALVSSVLKNQLLAEVDLSDYFPQLDPHSLTDAVIYEFVRNLLWTVGLNGHLVLATYKQDLYHMTQLAIENYELYGESLPILSSSFYDIYSGIGGAGNTLSLAISMLLFAKDDSYRKLALAVLPLGMFNINEPIIYGLPIMFNPMLAIPFLLTPIVSLLLAYAATFVGLVPPVIDIVSWMTPVLLSGYLATGELIDPVLLQLVILALGVAIYTPFLRKMNVQQVKQSKEKVFIYDLLGLHAQRNELKHAHSLHKNLNLINTIGEKLSTSDSLSQPAMDIFHDIQRVIGCNAFAIGVFDEKENKVHYEQFITDGEQIPPFSVDCSDLSSLSAVCVQRGEAFYDSHHSYNALAKKLGVQRESLVVVGSHNKESLSIMYAPITLNGELLGVLTCQSLEENKYQEYHFSLFKQLASYLAVGLKNLQQREQLKQQKHELHKLAITDPLTQLYNRQSLVELLAESKDKIRPNNQLGLILIDIDYFKQYNDNYGHIPGDHLLVSLSTMLQAFFSGSNYKVVRYGGDEVLILVDSATKSSLESQLEQLKLTLWAQQIENKESPFGVVTLSIGAALFADNEHEGSDMINIADQVLYAVKKTGRNNYMVAQVESEALVKELA